MLRGISLALGLALMAALTTSAVLTLAHRESVSGVEASARTVTFDGGRLDASSYTWMSGSVEVLIRNEDLRVHTLTSARQGIDIAIGPKSENLVTLELEVGNYFFECRVPGHSERLKIDVEL